MNTCNRNLPMGGRYYFGGSKSAGFTLVELIFVMVILGLLAALGSNFLVTTITMYNSTSERVAVMQRGRVPLEQMSRYLRGAVPNSVRVSASGKCVEFLPAIGGGNYLTTLPDSSNAAAAVSAATTGPFYISAGTPRYFVVAPLSNGDLYTASSTSARVGISSLTGTPATSVNFSAAKIFTRNSVAKRFFIAENPLRFCFIGSQLVRFSNYGFVTAGVSDTDPGGSTDIMSDAITLSGSSFVLSPGSEDRNTVLAISLALAKGNTRLTLSHKVLVRNVP